jgi:hypothetical protein
MGLDGFDRRLRRAHRAFEDRLGRDVNQTELGAMVGKRLGEPKPITQASVHRWFAGTLPDHVRMVALAEILGVDPGWLAYGDWTPPATGLPREPERAVGETEMALRPRAVGEARGDRASRPANRSSRGDTRTGEP